MDSRLNKILRFSFSMIFYYIRILIFNFKKFIDAGSIPKKRSSKLWLRASTGFWCLVWFQLLFFYFTCLAFDQWRFLTLAPIHFFENGSLNKENNNYCEDVLCFFCFFSFLNPNFELDLKVWFVNFGLWFYDSVQVYFAGIIWF